MEPMDVERNDATPREYIPQRRELFGRVVHVPCHVTDGPVPMTASERKELAEALEILRKALRRKGVT